MNKKEPRTDVNTTIQREAALMMRKFHCLQSETQDGPVCGGLVTRKTDTGATWDLGPEYGRVEVGRDLALFQCDRCFDIYTDTTDEDAILANFRARNYILP